MKRAILAALITGGLFGAASHASAQPKDVRFLKVSRSGGSFSALGVPAVSERAAHAAAQSSSPRRKLRKVYISRSGGSAAANPIRVTRKG